MKIKIIENAPSFARGMRGKYCWDWIGRVLPAIAGKWLQVEVDYIFLNQYNTAPIPGVTEGLRIFSEMVADVDYEGDAKLEAIHKAIQSGAIRCHSYCHQTGVGFVDLSSPLSEDIAKLMS